MKRIHFVHIPKTGGTALTSALHALPAAGRFVIHDHSITLSHIPVGEKVFFSIREPITRFVSAFNSRLRKGQPRYYFEWTPIQKKVFARFSTPNQLAEALSSGDVDDRRLAASLLEDMLLAAPLSFWLKSKEYVLQRSNDIVDIFTQETLSDDFERLKALVGLPAALRLPDDPVASHRAAPSASTFLSDVAIGNLRAWYADDFVLHKAVCEVRSNIRLRGADAGTIPSATITPSAGISIGQQLPVWRWHWNQQGKT